MSKESPAIEAFKLWIFPSLVSLLGLMIWNDVNEIKADVKALMAQSNIDKTRIDNLERSIYSKEAASFPSPVPQLPQFMQVVALKPDDNLETKPSI